MLISLNLPGDAYQCKPILYKHNIYNIYHIYNLWDGHVPVDATSVRLLPALP
jgi:hypothetical protein